MTTAFTTADSETSRAKASWIGKAAHELTLHPGYTGKSAFQIAKRMASRVDFAFTGAARPDPVEMARDEVNFWNQARWSSNDPAPTTDGPPKRDPIGEWLN